MNGLKVFEMWHGNKTMSLAYLYTTGGIIYVLGGTVRWSGPVLLWTLCPLIDNLALIFAIHDNFVGFSVHSDHEFPRNLKQVFTRWVTFMMQCEWFVIDESRCAENLPGAWMKFHYSGLGWFKCPYAGRLTSHVMSPPLNNSSEWSSYLGTRAHKVHVTSERMYPRLG